MQTSAITLNVWDALYGEFWWYIMQRRNLQVFLVGETFFLQKKEDFWAIAATKKQWQLTILKNLTMVFSYSSYFIDLPVVLIDCQVEGCLWRLYQNFQWEYVTLKDFKFYRGERNICRGCVGELGGGWVGEIEEGRIQQRFQDGWNGGGWRVIGGYIAWVWG